MPLVAHFEQMAMIQEAMDSSQCAHEGFMQMMKEIDELCQGLTARIANLQVNAGVVLMMVASESSDEDWDPVSVPSPRSRSLVTFVNLLPEVAKLALPWGDLAMIVAMLTSGNDDERRDFSRGVFWAGPLPTGQMAEAGWHRTLAGGKRSGTDVPQFRHAPDPPKGESRQVQVAVGTDERCFRGPPDPARRGRTRVVLTRKRGAPGTSVLGFRIPPDGGLWRPGPRTSGRATMAAGTEERCFRRPTDRRKSRWDRMLFDFVG